MEEISDKIRQEAAVEIINQCKQWLAQVIEEEKEAEQEAVMYIAEAKQKVEQIVAGFDEEIKHSLAKGREQTRIREKVS